MHSSATPGRDCPLCPRLVEYRHENRARYPAGWNAPVPFWGEASARLLIVGLAPGVRGANLSGRPFTGDYAGILLYATLIKFGFATGSYGARPDDGLCLKDCRVINAVRCVPPANNPKPAEIKTCNSFLKADLKQMPNLKAILALGVVAHKAVLTACGLPMSRLPFVHGKVNRLPSGCLLMDSYHVSRYNTSTRRLTREMFEQVVADLRAYLEPE